MKFENWLFGKDGALFRAAAQGKMDLARELVSLGANVNAASKSGFTPLHRASQNGHADIVRFLVDAGANPAAESRDRKTPLMLATDSGHGEIAAFLRRRIART